MRIPLSFPDIGPAEIDAVTNVLTSGRLSLGPRLEEFEAAFAVYTGAKNAVAVNSGTSALHLAVRALEIGEGDEVILPSFAFIAVANVLRYQGAIPVFVDVDPLTLNLDTGRIEEAITPRTRAILAVHTFGVPAAMQEIGGLARRHGLRVIEDACEGLGAELEGRKVGTFGDIGIFGFYPNKQITTGEGGMAVTEDTEIAARMRSLRNHGRSAVAHEWDFSEVGYNYRLSELHCALGIEQLKRVEEILQRRAQVALGYQRHLDSTSGLQLPVQAIPGGRMSWFVYVVRLVEATPGRRDTMVRKLAEKGIQTGRYFPAIHRQPPFREFVRQPLRFTESIAESTIALPFFTRMTEDQVEEVARALRTALEGTA